MYDRQDRCLFQTALYRIYKTVQKYALNPLMLYNKSRGARHFVEHVAVILLTDVVYDNNRQRVPAGKAFDKGDVPVIACVSVVFGCGADFLQGVNDNEPVLAGFL